MALSTGRTWLARLLLALVVPGLVLATAELALRAFGYGHSPRYFVEASVPPAADPALGGEDVHWTNPRFGWRFFGPELSRPPLPTAIRRKKPEDRYRIFVLGGSAARGFPNPAFSFGRILEAMLQDAFPDKRFELVNTGMTAINSHVVREIARDCARFDPDLFLVYLGNNEVVGPFGVGTVFRGPVRSLRSIRLALFARSTRLGQLLARISRRIAGPDEATRREWGGMQMFLDQSVPAHHPGLRRVYEHFEENLRAVCDVGREASVPVVLSTALVNLKDNPPFGSTHRDDLDEEARAAFASLMEAGRDLREQGQIQDALERYRRAEAIDAGYAKTHFGIGTCQLLLGREQEARDSFQRAADLDVLRFRADTRINQIVRSLATADDSDHVHLVDAEATASADPRGGGIPGRELLHEHVHPNFLGNYLLARAMFDVVVGLLPPDVRPEGAGAVSPPDLERCAALVGFNDFFEFVDAEQIIGVTSHPPFGRGASDPHRQKARAILHQLTPAALSRMAGQYEAAVEEDPDDVFLRGNYAHLQLYRGQHEAARRQYEALLERYPLDSFWRHRVGEALLGRGAIEEAIEVFSDLIERDPYYLQARVSRGGALEAAGREEEARAAYEEVLGLQPRHAEVRFRLGNMLLQRGELEAAQAQLQAAVDADPAHGEAQFYLAKVLDRRGLLQKALNVYQRADDLLPNNAAIQYNAATIYFRLGAVEHARRLYHWAVELDESFGHNPPYRLASVIDRPDAAEGTILQLERRVQEDAQNPRVWFQLGWALELRGQSDLAVGSYRRALELDPQLEEALARLAWVLATREPAEAGSSAEAVRLADQACALSGYEDPHHLDVLAAAQARAGHFEQALTTARKALQVADRVGPSTLVEQLRLRLAAYRAGRAVRVSAG